MDRAGLARAGPGRAGEVAGAADGARGGPGRAARAPGGVRAPGAPGGRAAEGAGVAVGARGGGGARARGVGCSTTHDCYGPNPNHMDRKETAIVEFTSSLKERDEDTNFYNKELVNTYNAMWKLGQAYAALDRFGSAFAGQRKTMLNNFKGLIARYSALRTRVMGRGGNAIPFPSIVRNTLPGEFLAILLESAVV